MIGVPLTLLAFHEGAHRLTGGEGARLRFAVGKEHALPWREATARMWFTFLLGFSSAPVLLEVTPGKGVTEGVKGAESRFRWASIAGTALAVLPGAAILAGWALGLIAAPILISVPLLILVGFAASALSTGQTLRDDFEKWARKPGLTPAPTMPSAEDATIPSIDQHLLNAIENQHSRRFAETERLVANLVFLRRGQVFPEAQKTPPAGLVLEDRAMAEIMNAMSLDALIGNDNDKIAAFQGFMDRNREWLMEDLMTRYDMFPQIQGDIDRAMRALNPDLAGKIEADRENYEKGRKLLRQMVANGTKLADVDVVYYDLQKLEPGQENLGLLYWLAAQVEAGKPVLLNVSGTVWGRVMGLLQREKAKSQALADLEKNLRKFVKIVDEPGVNNQEGRRVVPLKNLLIKQGGPFKQAALGNGRLRVSALDLRSLDMSGLENTPIELILLTISGIPLRVLADQMKAGQDYDKMKQFIAQFA